MKMMTTTLSLLGASALLAGSAQAAIIVGNTTTDLNNNFSGSGTTTGSHTVANDSNRLLIVTIAGEADGPPNFTSVTYGTQSLTQASQAVSTTSGANRQLAQIWYLLNPSVGSNTVTVAESVGGGSTAYYDVMVMNFANVAQAGPFDTDGSGSETHASSQTLSFDTSGVTPGAILIGAADLNQTGDVPEPDSGVTSYTNANFDHATGAGYKILGSGDVGGSVDWTWSWAANDYAITGVAFAEVVPEPGSLALLAIGGLLMARRRRDS